MDEVLILNIEVILVMDIQYVVLKIFLVQRKYNTLLKHEKKLENII
jgi:hypothetical protein